MGIGSEFRKIGRKYEDFTRRSAKYTMATAGAIFGGPAGAKAGYEIGSTFDDRKPNRQSGTDLGKLRSDAVANGFNPLTVLRATGGQGFYKDQVPMGRLSSDAFFNAFDAYDTYKNKNVSVDNLNDNMMYGSDVVATTSPKQSKLTFTKNNSPLYPVRETEIENNYISTGEKFVSNKVEPLLRPMKLPDGRVVNVPFDPQDMDLLNVLMGYGALGLSKFTQLFPEIRPIKGFRNFGKLIRDKAKQDTNKESDLLLKLQQQMNYKEGAISQKALGTLRNISAEDKKFVDYMKAQF